MNDTMFQQTASIQNVAILGLQIQRSLLSFNITHTCGETSSKAMEQCLLDDSFMMPPLRKILDLRENLSLLS